METYEYAGFEYLIVREGDEIRMEPAPEQHPAANKLKHRMAALECYEADHAQK